MAKTSAAAVVLLVIGSVLAAPAQEKLRSTWGIFEDPDSDCGFQVGKGTLTITVPGKDHDLGYERGKMNAPRAMQAADGDFTVEVKVSGTFEPRQVTNLERLAYHGAGFFIRKDEKNYIRLDRATLWDGMMNRAYANFEVRVDGQVQRFGRTNDLPLDNAKDAWLKIERKGEKYIAYVTQEPGKWNRLGERTMAAGKTVQVGLAAINSSMQSFIPQFSGYELKENE